MCAPRENLISKQDLCIVSQGQPFYSSVGSLCCCMSKSVIFYWLEGLLDSVIGSYPSKQLRERRVSNEVAASLPHSFFMTSSGASPNCFHHLVPVKQRSKQHSNNTDSHKLGQQLFLRLWSSICQSPAKFRLLITNLFSD